MRATHEKLIRQIGRLLDVANVFVMIGQHLSTDGELKKRTEEISSTLKSCSNDWVNDVYLCCAQNDNQINSQDTANLQSRITQQHIEERLFHVQRTIASMEETAGTPLGAIREILSNSRQTLSTYSRHRTAITTELVKDEQAYKALYIILKDGHSKQSQSVH